MKVAAVVIALASFPASLWAHALGAECTLRQGQLLVEAFYDDDSPAGQAKVRVLDEQGHELATGTTDAKGLWQTTAPPAGKYKVTVDAGDGHFVARRLEVKGATSVGKVVSDGPVREEFTRYPWLKIGLGLGAIAVFLLVFFLFSVRARRVTTPTELGERET